MSTTTAITPSTTSPALTWATKNGTVKTRHTESGAARGNRAARLSKADQATLTRMIGGDYSGYMRDVGACLPVGYLKGLKAHFTTWAHAQVENLSAKQLIALTGDTPLANDSKLVMTALAEFMAAPLKEVKKVASPAALPKSQRWLAELAAAWLANENAVAIAVAANMADVPAVDTGKRLTDILYGRTEATEAHEVDLENLITA